VSALGRDPHLQEAVRRDMRAVPDHVALACVSAMREWDGEAAARACRVPAVHIAADDPINDAAALRALNPMFRTGQTVGAGHFNLLEVPDQVNAMIERFLLIALE
jgi:pimeloyl-ACP methyl ester carboxylesterase